MRQNYPGQTVLMEGEVELRVGHRPVDAAHPLPVTAPAPLLIAIPNPLPVQETDPVAVRSNTEVVLLASAARTVATSSADQVNTNNSGLILIVNITDDPAAASITPTLQIRDPISGNYFTVWTAAVALAAIGMAAYLFDIGGVGVAGSFSEAVNIRLTRTWRFSMTVANANSITYSVSANNLV